MMGQFRVEKRKGTLTLTCIQNLGTDLGGIDRGALAEITHDLVLETAPEQGLGHRVHPL